MNCFQSVMSHRVTELCTLHRKRFTLQPLADLFIQLLIGKHSDMLQLLREDYSYHISTSVCSQVLTYTAQRTGATRSERNCPSFETAARGFENGFSRLRFRCSNHCATLPRGVIKILKMFDASYTNLDAWHLV